MQKFAIASLIAVVTIACGTPAPPPSPTEQTNVELVLPAGFDSA
jgi:hypothetical protein